MLNNRTVYCIESFPDYFYCDEIDSGNKLNYCGYEYIVQSHFFSNKGMCIFMRILSVLYLQLTDNWRNLFS